MDRVVISEKLESLRRCLARLKAKCPDTPEALQGDLDAQDIVSLNLTRAIQLWSISPPTGLLIMMS